MSNGCDPCKSKTNNMIRQYTNTIISNEDDETHLRVFRQHSVIFKMSLPKTRIKDPLPFVGYFQQTYGASTLSLNIPPASECGPISVIAFSGWVDPSSTNPLQNPLTLANQQFNLLQGTDKYVTLGGGTLPITNTLLTTTYLTYINGKMFKTPSGTQYTGIVFDVELIDWNVDISVLIASYIAVFKAAKANGYKVIVTVSHDGFGTIEGLMQTFLTSTDIDYLAPQLYHLGNCNDSPSVQTNTVYPNTNWSSWVGAIPKIIPVVTFIPLFCQVRDFFASLPTPIPLSGGIVWNNDTAWQPGQPAPCIPGPPLIINITNATSYVLYVNGSTTAINPNDPVSSIPLNVPVGSGVELVVDVYFYTSSAPSKAAVNLGTIACNSLYIAIDFGYGNNGVLTNISASGDFNGTKFTNLGQSPVPSNPIGAPTTGTNTLNITYSDNNP
jgi:hypothetical protein